MAEEQKPKLDEEMDDQLHIGEEEELKFRSLQDVGADQGYPLDEDRMVPAVYRGGGHGGLLVQSEFGAGGIGGLGHQHQWGGGGLQEYAPAQPKKGELYVQELVAPAAGEPIDEDAPPMAPGGWMEPNYHFLSNTAPAALFGHLKGVLESLDIDFIVKPAKFKYKCVGYREGARLPFYVRIFSTDVRKRYAVEFQRRSGDIIHFSALYRECKSKLAHKGLVVLPPGTKLAPFKKFEPLPPLPPMEDEDIAQTTEEVTATVSCLLGMATSKCADIQTQGMQALSQLTLSDPAKEILRSQDTGFGVLVESLASPTEDVHRCAISGLANLIEGNQDACQRLRDAKGVDSLFDLASTTDTPQVVRESARALLNLVKIFGVSIADEDFKRNLENLSQTSDTATTNHVREMRGVLGLVGA